MLLCYWCCYYYFPSNNASPSITAQPPSWAGYSRHSTPPLISHCYHHYPYYLVFWYYLLWFIHKVITSPYFLFSLLNSPCLIWITLWRIMPQSLMSLCTLLPCQMSSMCSLLMTGVSTTCGRLAFWKDCCYVNFLTLSIVRNYRLVVWTMTPLGRWDSCYAVA